MPASAITMGGTADHDGAEWAITMSETCKKTVGAVTELHQLLVDDEPVVLDEIAELPPSPRPRRRRDGPGRPLGAKAGVRSFAPIVDALADAIHLMPPNARGVAPSMIPSRRAHPIVVHADP
jgi:hypothetical protein